MSILIGDESKVKYTELKYCRFQHAETSKATYSLQNRNTADANMQREGNQIERNRKEILNISISRDDASKVKYAGVKYRNYEYAETR